MGDKTSFELSGFASLSLNDSFWVHYTISGSVIFYPHDSFGVGLGFDYLFAHAATSNLEVMRASEKAVPPVMEKPHLFAHADLFPPAFHRLSVTESPVNKPAKFSGFELPCGAVLFLIRLTF